MGAVTDHPARNARIRDSAGGRDAPSAAGTSPPADAPAGDEPLPFVAPCRKVPASAPIEWLRLGWQDLRRAPRQSLGYGLVLFALSWVVLLGALRIGGLALLVGLLSGFVFLGPVLAVGLYSISCQLERGQKPRLGRCLADSRRQIANALVFSLLLLIVFLIWARAASMIHVFFPLRAEPGLADLLWFLGIGSAVGSIFAALIFAAAAFSLPMILDRRADMVTAVLTSIHAVRENLPAMAVWAGWIVLLVGIGLLTGLLGLIVALPVIGHATWHAYRQVIDARAWPAQDD